METPEMAMDVHQHARQKNIGDVPARTKRLRPAPPFVVTEYALESRPSAEAVMTTTRSLAMAAIVNASKKMDGTALDKELASASERAQISQ